MEQSRRTAIVTGGARGIGRAIAGRLASDGLSVAVWDLNADGARRAAEELKVKGCVASSAGVDVSKSEQVRVATAQLVQEWGRIDCLVNNAGWDKLTLFLESSEETWDKVIGVVYRGVLNTCRYVGPEIVKSKGRIVNIASDTAKIGFAMEAVYSGAKGAVVSFSRALARELGPLGVCVNVICPGATDTPLFREAQADLEARADYKAAFPDGFDREVIKSIPLGRLGQPQDLANAVSFLLEPASGFITGQSFSVDGGQTMY